MSEATSAPPAPAPAPEAPAPTPEPPAPTEAPTGLEEVKESRDTAVQKAEEKEGIPSQEGEATEEGRTSSSRELVKERAAMIRAQKERDEEQRKRDEEMQKLAKDRAEAESKKDLVRVRHGAFGEVEGIKTRLKAEADGDKIVESKPPSRFKSWVKNH